MDKKEQIKELLLSKELELPKEAVLETLNNFDEEKWAIKEIDGKIASMVHYEQNDWYLCTIKNLYTIPDQREKGFGTEVIEKLLEKMDNNDNCLVYGADIDYINDVSKNRFLKAGFKAINQFCYGGERPAEILHYVKVQADKKNKC